MRGEGGTAGAMWGREWGRGEGCPPIKWRTWSAGFYFKYATAKFQCPIIYCSSFEGENLTIFCLRGRRERNCTVYTVQYIYTNATYREAEVTSSDM